MTTQTAAAADLHQAVAAAIDATGFHAMARDYLEAPSAACRHQRPHRARLAMAALTMISLTITTIPSLSAGTDAFASPYLARPPRTHIRAVAEIAMAAYGAPRFFRFAGEWVPASRALQGPRYGLDPVPDAMLLPQARVYVLDRDAWAGIVQRAVEQMVAA